MKLVKVSLSVISKLILCLVLISIVTGSTFKSKSQMRIKTAEKLLEQYQDFQKKAESFKSGKYITILVIRKYIGYFRRYFRT
jgi:hypothetical protein